VAYRGKRKKHIKEWEKIRPLHTLGKRGIESPKNLIIKHFGLFVGIKTIIHFRLMKKLFRVVEHFSHKKKENKLLEESSSYEDTKKLI
jgi:hypothetical protein